MDKLLLANSYFIKSFTLSILKTIAKKNFGYSKIISSPINYAIPKSIINKPQLDLMNLPRPPIHLSTIPIPPIELRGNFSIQVPKNYNIPQGYYGKLSQLINDNSITMIECNGANKEITLFKAGEKQSTKISLTEEEIKSLLQKIATKANIPLMSGVFKARLDNFEVNAVISEVIGTRFIIRKNTPYNIIKAKPPSNPFTI